MFLECLCQARNYYLGTPSHRLSSCGPNIPGYEPRGCPRGASFSWYEYSPVRIKYPYIRGKLWELWTAAKEEHENPLDAWASIVEDPEKSKKYKKVRGHGGLIRVHRYEALEMISAACLYTIKKYGPDRIVVLPQFLQCQ